MCFLYTNDLRKIELLATMRKQEQAKREQLVPKNPHIALNVWCGVQCAAGSRI